MEQLLETPGVIPALLIFGAFVAVLWNWLGEKLQQRDKD